MDENQLQKARNTSNAITTDAAHNAMGNIGIGIDVIKAHIRHPKTQQWRDQTSWLMSCVRNEALNGVDAMGALDTSVDTELHKSGIRRSHNYAQSALFSHESPQMGAFALTRPHPVTQAPSPLYQYIDTYQSVQKVIHNWLLLRQQGQSQMEKPEQSAPLPRPRLRVGGN